jgi:predicted solute-binding protein
MAGYSDNQLREITERLRRIVCVRNPGLIGPMVQEYLRSVKYKTGSSNERVIHHFIEVADHEATH